MIQDGQLVLLTFPRTDQTAGKLRPALVLRRLPSSHADWLICMISSQLQHEVPGVDEVVRHADADFTETGLKETSLVRVTRLAVVAADILHGTIGSLSDRRLTRIRRRLANWILGMPEQGSEAEQPGQLGN